MGFDERPFLELARSNVPEKSCMALPCGGAIERGRQRLPCHANDLPIAFLIGAARARSTAAGEKAGMPLMDGGIVRGRRKLAGGAGEEGNAREGGPEIGWKVENGSART